MILPIYTYGQPVLRKVAQDVAVDDPTLKTFIADMFETLDASEGVGLAAPQVGKALRVVVIDLDVLKDDMPEYAGFRHAYVNAHIVEYDEKSKKESMDEGCLSIPGLHESVTRPTRIHVTYLDEQLAPHDEWVDGYLARVMQHEFDVCRSLVGLPQADDQQQTARHRTRQVPLCLSCEGSEALTPP